MHFVIPGYYLDVIPEWLPGHIIIMYLSGICEIIFGLMLLSPRTRRTGAKLIMIMLIVFFVIHIHMLVKHWGHRTLWILACRFFLQFFLVWWAYLYTGKSR